MLFFRADGILSIPSPDIEENQRALREVKRKIRILSDSYNEKHGDDYFIFVSSLAKEQMTLGIIAETPEKLEQTLDSFLKHIKQPLTDLVTKEVTYGSIRSLLNVASRQDFIEDDDDILERFGLDRLRNVHLEFGDNISVSMTKSESIHRAELHLFSSTFLPELQRIYHGTTSARPTGHPVHYMIQTDHPTARREIYQALIHSLWANKRISSRRYSFLDFHPGKDFSMSAYHSLYSISAGGVVVVRYNTASDEDDGEYASGEQDTIERICKMAKQYRNQVLTILCLPRECKNTKALFYENLGSMTFVELQEDFATDEQARAFLKMTAREYRIRPDKALFNALEPGKSYLANDLRRLFDNWHAKKLKTSIYPQYKDLHVADQKVIKAAHKGNAYDELRAMVGLAEAKGVIQKALNFYKMQKLYEERGIRSETPAMHMVFTGNPGTAKTTVARLFSRIMKDNGLLSKGQLVEVGRGDLVGKYVGWTAQTVQKKFQEAQGGVLFIDEAYSLVDDRSGSFGDEAINTIVQEMENHRQDVVVIFAGYPEPMEKFLQKNPGLRSRIAFHVPFADYNAEELCQIAQLMGKGLSFEPDAMEKLHTAFEAARTRSDFGNGRYVRNLLEQARMNQASRLLEYDYDAITVEEIQTIKAVDIMVPEIKTETTRTIGFAC